jgi:broad specificity phosphatase PhoE
VLIQETYRIKYINGGETIMIYLVRQGETDWNLFKKFNGRTDTELNQTGVAQAKRQAANLRSVNFNACFCSPQTRARQTCEIIYQGPSVFDDRLVEIDCGEFEGKEETAGMIKSFWQAAVNGDKGAESFKAFIKRCCDFCDMIAEDHRGKNVLIVTHAANVRVIDYYFKGKPRDYDFKKPTVIETGGLLMFEN